MISSNYNYDPCSVKHGFCECSETKTDVEQIPNNEVIREGRRRNPADWTSYTVTPFAYINRGYTGHEHLENFGLINMNGRMYDPLTARFLSADPFVPNPFSSQDYNRYSYVLNNPLKYTDPSGYTQINWGHNPTWNNMVTQLANEQGAWNSQFGWNSGYINYNAFGISQFIGGGGGGGGLQLSDFGLSDISSGQLTTLNSMLEGTGIQITGYSSLGIQLTISWYEGKGGITTIGDGWFGQIAQTYAFKNVFVGLGSGGAVDSRVIDVMDIANYIVSNSGTLVGGAQYGVYSMSNKQQWKYSYKASKYLKGKGVNVQTRAIKHGANGVLKNVSRKITYVGGVLAVADVAIDGELRASHLLNVGIVGVSAIPVAGWIFGGVYFAADMITLGVSGQSIGQHLDNAVGTPLVNDVYNW